MFADGVMFDGSSIAGWKAINESDMVLMPDTTTAHMDPFFAQSTMAIFCDILDPITGEAYSRDPRTTAKKAEAYLASGGFGDTVYFGPEPEFFIFDDVKFKADPYNTGFKLDSSNCRPTWTPTTKPATWATVRAPRAATSRSRRSTVARTCAPKCSPVMAEMGVTVEKHHHEVALPSTSLHQVRHADPHGRQEVQIYKYVVHRLLTPTARRQPSCRSRSSATTARACTCTSRSGRTASPPSPATSMPACRKPACTTSAASSSTPRPLNAFTNPSTNSYKRLVPGYEAPVLLAYSARNRSASCRIPLHSSPKGKRVEVRFPRSDRQPVPGLRSHADGRHRRHQEQDPPRARPMDKDLYDLPPEELKEIPTVAVRCVKRWNPSTRIASSSPPAASSTTIRSMPSSS
jgi:glutamine synthetase